MEQMTDMSISADEPGDDRMTQLESKLSFLEHTVEVLSGELETQQTETRQLNKKIEGLQEQLGSLQRDPGVSEHQHEPPPHY
jgi:SlyX protein